MRRSLLLRQVLPSLFWYSLLIASALGTDYLLHRVGWVWVGRYLGILGTLLILVSFLYSLRKRKIIQRGSPKFLLDLHEVLCWAGALMILVHSGIHFNALLPWAAVVLMLVVVASGFTGKNLLKDARERVRTKEAALRAGGLSGEALESRLLLDSLTVDAMKNWRAVHLPITTLFGTLVLLHVLSILVYWSW